MEINGGAVELLSISIGDDQHYQFPIPPDDPSFEKHSRNLHVVFVGTLNKVYGPLIILLHLSPLEIHYSIMIISVVAFIIATRTSRVLIYTMDHSQSLTRHFSLIYYTIINTVICFSGVLALLSFVLTMFIPHNLNWIGYLIILILFGLVVGCYFYVYIKLRGNERSTQLGN
ncbi:hypothetical protein OSB04_020466 [Centaurea solstitialis]|uniref:Uncharacterized protein n=1 Tax=Centaurea solstitialis TaxID=347529 RepID=A0AA38SZX3_9ASTR|nr:hypothetical protein OSB04_020466 [Centaurea solstitialis]